MKSKLITVAIIIIAVASVATATMAMRWRAPTDTDIQSDITEYLKKNLPNQVDQFSNLKVNGTDCVEDPVSADCKFQVEYTDTSLGQTYKVGGVNLLYFKDAGFPSKDDYTQCKLFFIWDSLLRHSKYNYDDRPSYSVSECTYLDGLYGRYEQDVSNGVFFTLVEENGKKVVVAAPWTPKHAEATYKNYLNRVHGSNGYELNSLECRYIKPEHYQCAVDGKATDGPPFFDASMMKYTQRISKLRSIITIGLVNGKILYKF